MYLQIILAEISKSITHVLNYMLNQKRLQCSSEKWEAQVVCSFSWGYRSYSLRDCAQRKSRNNYKI